LPKTKIRQIGLARALSKLGYCSRSQASALIRAGRVTLNGSERRDPETPTRLERDQIKVDGQSVSSAQKLYFIMNKPRGLVTTASDEKGRDTIYSLFGGKPNSWVAPVGRLDKASEGLLLLTNDSEWGATIAAPETHLPKTYHVQMKGVVTESDAQPMLRGLQVDGDSLRAQSVRLLRTGEKNCWLEITLDEGKNRQIRRMLAALGFEVLRLIRVSIGPLQLAELAKGTYRPLTIDEKLALDGAIAPRGKKARCTI